MELLLGDTKWPLRATGRVSWVSLMRADGRIGLGVEFQDLSPDDRTALTRFLAEHRPRVVVALASPAEKELARKALEHVYLDFIDEEAELTDDTLRAASIFVFGEERSRLTRFLEVLAALRPEADVIPGEQPVPPVVLCTGLSSDVLLPLFSAGRVYDVLRPPVDRSTLALSAERSCERWAMQLELRWASLKLEGLAFRRHDRVASPPARDLPETTSKMVRASAPMQRAFELMQTVAVHDVPVLLVGETGTGKELAAREVHALSRRSDTAFVALDCGALTETLLESELFGHVRGAFTGATSDHPGLFQIADGGTIFLDEIQNTTPATQAKLLRVVEEGEVRPVGSPRVRRVNVRVIAACNVDLRDEVKSQRFRADFFYRLNRFPIELPPLRQRPDDIIPLARYFVAAHSQTLGRPPQSITTSAQATLLAYDWPGNIRELKNAIERAILLTPPGEPLGHEALPDDVRRAPGPGSIAPGSLDEQVDEFQRRIIRAALDRHEGIVRRAARELRMNPVTLSRKVRRLGLA